MITAPELKGWLYRYISEYAAEHQDYAGQHPKDRHYPASAAALDRLAEHVQTLPADDERLVRLATAYPQQQSLAELPIGGNRQLRCASLGPGLWAGDDPTSSSATTCRWRWRCCAGCTAIVVTAIGKTGIAYYSGSLKLPDGSEVRASRPGNRAGSTLADDADVRLRGYAGE